MWVSEVEVIFASGQSSSGLHYNFFVELDSVNPSVQLHLIHFFYHNDGLPAALTE